MLGNLFTSSKQPEPSAPVTPPATPAQASTQQTTQQTVQRTTEISASGPAVVVAAPIVATPVVPVVPVQSVQTTTNTTTTSANTPPGSTTATANTPGSNGAMDPNRRGDLSALSHLDSRAMQALSHAQQEAARIKQALIMPEQLLFGLLYDSEVYKLLEQFSVDGAKLSRELQAKEQMGTFSGQPTLSDPVKQIFESAFQNAKDRSSNFIAPEDLLISMFASSTGALLQAQGVDKEKLQQTLSKSAAYTEGRKTVLDKFGVELTAKAQEGGLDPIAGREKEIDRLVHILLRRTKNNPIIIGEAGVGKTAIVEGLAQEIVDKKVPEQLQNKKIIQLDIASIVAGASHRGEFEERLRSVMRDAMSSGGQVILFIDEIHTLIGAGDNEGALDASNIIKPNLARGQLQIIGTTTTSEYRKYFEKDKAFARRFQPITCEEPDEETAVKMMQVLKAKYEKFHDVTIPDEALEAAVKLSKKYVGERLLPDKAVDLIDEAAAEVKLQHSSGKRQDNIVQRSDIEKIISSWTGIPITKLTEDESAKLLELEKRIHQRLIDQKQAVDAVSEAVRRGRIGLASANRPIASFIFLGPTGTGKTELAKTLAEILFGKDDAMIRLDMSEYMEKHEVAKLIGAPPGYVGYEEGGQLTEAVRQKPYSIVLLDEVEKAHPDVFNILLQLLEDGRLTDNKGNTISFKNTIVIATSNIGSQAIQEELSKPAATSEEFQKRYKEMQDKVSQELHKFFRPELLNRFDEIVMFKPLLQEDMKYIAKLGIHNTEKLLKDQGFSLQITDTALDVLGKEGYDPQYGARPLRRLIQTAIENPIAMLIINRTFVSGDIIKIDYDQQKTQFTFTKGVPETTQPGATPNGQLPQQVDAAQPTAPGAENPAGQPAQPVDVANPNTPQQPVAPQDGSAGAAKVMPTVSDVANAPTSSTASAPAVDQQTIDAAVAASQSLQQPAPTAPAPVQDTSGGLLSPIQPTTPSLSSVDQMPTQPPAGAAMAASSFAPPTVAAAGLLAEEDGESIKFA